MGNNLFIFGYGNRGLVLVIIFSTVLVMDIDVSCFLLRQKLFRAIARAQSTSIRCLRADAFSGGTSARRLIRLLTNKLKWFKFGVFFLRCLGTDHE